jgi:hypothetical protein
MNPHLKFFTDPSILRRVQRNILTPVLETFQSCLPPETAALVKNSDFDNFCNGLSAQFRSLAAFGAPLIEALVAIETLALPENHLLLEEGLSHLPTGFEVSRTRPSLNQALHLWLITRNHPEVPWPLPPTPESKCEPETSSAAGTVPEPSTASPPLIQQSTNPSIQPGPPEPATSAPSEFEPSTFPVLHSFSEGGNLQPSTASDANALIQSEEPWPDPIADAPALFDEVHDRCLLYLHLPPGAAVVLTLWPGHANAVHAFAHSPRLNLTSLEPGYGKTTVLDLLATFIPNSLRTDNLKPAVIYRLINQQPITLLLDELDSYLHLYSELRGILNAGYSRGGCVFRCEGKTARGFTVFAAAALAGLGQLAPTLRSRCIIIHLPKAPPGAIQVRFDKRHTEIETILGRKIARWARDNFAAIAACDPVMPDTAFNRLADNWRPLFAIAQIIGGHWPQRALNAFHAFTAKPQLHDLNLLLLADIRQIFAAAGTDRLFSSALIQALHALPNRPWSGTNNGDQPLTERRLARRLGDLGIHPQSLRLRGVHARGYLLSSFLPPPAPASPSPPLDFQV